MALLQVLAFDHEGRPIQFDTWLDDLQLYLLSDSKDSVSLFDLASGAATAHPATANSATRSQWLTRVASARLAIRNHLPLAECAHFGQHRTAQALCDAVVARYSSPATTALGRLILPYLFPELSAFATVEDLLREWLVRCARLRSGASGAGAGDPTEPGAAWAGGTGAGGAGAGRAGAGGTGEGGAGERREPASRLVLPVCTACRVPRPRPPPVANTHAMALRPSSVPLRVPLPPPPECSLPAVPDPESDLSAAASALVAELLNFAAACHLDYATALVVESESAGPPSVGGECALGMDVLEDRQEDFECLAVAVPCLASMMLAPEGDPDAPDISTPCSYAEAITGPYSSQWQAAMDAEMASWKSTGTYTEAVPLSWANIVDGMWIFKVKRPPGSPPAFKACYVARGFSQRQGVDYFQNFSPTLKMTSLWVLLHVAAQRDYELHSLDFSTAFLQGSLHEEIWTTLVALGFAPSTADPSLFLCNDTSLAPFYVLVYVLQRFGFQISSPQPTPLSTGHSLSAPPSDESVEPSSPYPELVGCLMYLMTCTRPDLAYPLSLLARYVAPGRHRKVHWDAAKRVLHYLCSTSGMGFVLGGRGPVVLTGHADASWVDDSATQQSSQGDTFSLGSGSVSWRSTRSSLVLSSSCEAEIYAGAMAAQELRWLNYLLTDLGEQPRSPAVLYVDNKAMIALCQEHRLEHRTKHIALRYFLARELQQRGQLRLAYVATRANTADIFTKALPRGDHQRFSTFLGLLALLFLTGLVTTCSPPLCLWGTVTSATATAATAATTAILLQFDTWLDDLQLYLLSDSKDGVSLFDLASGAATAPPATADIARYSSPATAALGHLLLPYLFPELSSFATVEDLVSHLRASDARYRAAVPAEFLDRNPPPMYITLYFIVTRLPDSLSSVRDHFLSLDPTSLTIDLLEQHLLAAETSAVAVGAAHGTPRQPFFEGCSPSPLAPSYAFAAATDVYVAEDVGAVSASAKRRNSKGKGGWGGGGGSGGGGGGSGSGGGASSGGGGGGGSGGGSGGSGGGGGVCGGSGGSGSGGTGGGGTGARRVGSGGGQRQQQHRRSETLSPQQLREWFLHGPSGGSCPIAIFDLDFDAILFAMYALSVSPEGDCYLCVPPDPGIDAADLGASESGTLPGTVPAQALHHLHVGRRRLALSSPPLVLYERGEYRCPPGCDGHYHHSCGSACVDLHVHTDGTSPGHVHSSAKTLLWHHRLGHPSLPRLRGMHSCLLNSGLPKSLPPLPPSPAPPCLPCIKGHQRAAPHSSSFPPMTAPLQTLHMDVWGPARVSGQSRERYFLLVVDDYSRYTTVFPLRSKGQVVDVLIPWIRTVRLQLRERFGQDLPVLRLHSDRGGEFSSNLLRDFCHGEGILQTFTLSDSPQQYGIAERRIGLVMEVAPQPLAPCLLAGDLAHTVWMGKVGDASVFRVWGSRAFVRDTPADKLPPRTIPCVFLGFVPDTLGWQFYHPTLHRVFPSQDVTFDESLSFYRLFPYRSAPPPPPPLFLAPGPPPVDPLPPQGPAPCGVSQVDPLPSPAPVQVAFDSGAARGAASGGAEPGGAESEGAETGGAEPGGVATGGGEPGGAEHEGVEPGGAASEGAESGGAGLAGATGALPSLSPQQLREWFVRRTHLRSGATGAGGAGPAGAGGTGVAAGAGVTRGAATTGSGGARTRGTGAAGTGVAEGAGAGDLTESGATCAGGAGDGGAGVGGPGAGGAVVGGPGVGGVGAGGAGAVDPGGAVRPRPYFVPLLQQVLGTPPSAALTPPLLCPPPDQSQPPLQLASPPPAPSPYTEMSGGLTERREPVSRPVSPICTARRVPRSRPPPVHCTPAMTLRPSSVPLCVPLPAPPESSLPEVPDPASDRARAASPTFSRLLATTVTDPSFESATASALVAELLDFAAACHLDYATALVAESASSSPSSVGGECALGTDVLEDRQEDFESLAAAVPHFSSMLLAPEGDPDAPDFPTPRSYAEANTGPYSSQWQAAMDVKMASWKSTGTYVDEVPPPMATIVDGMWIFRVKRPPGSPPAFKARYVARGFSQRQGVDFFQTFSPTPKMTTLRVLLHVAAQRDYELHSLDFSTAFLQGSLHEEICLWRPFYGLRQAPRERHDTLRTTLAALGFAPATADPLLFLRTDTSLPPFYVLVYVLQRFGFQFSSPQPTPLSNSHSLSAPPSDESVEPSGPYPGLVGCLMYLMTCTRPDLAYPLSLLARCVAPGKHRKVHWDAAKMVLCYLCSTSGMGLVLGGRGPVVLTGHADASWVDDSATQRSSQGYTFSLGSGSVFWRSTRSSSVLSSSCEAEIYAGAMAAQELHWLTYLLTDLGEQPRSPPVLYVDNKAMLALCQEHRLEHRMKHIALRYFLARELQQRGQLRLAYVATWADTADIFTKALLPGDHQRFVTVLGLVPTLPHLLTS
ncbi:unnamed protein product [Closterium sp. NIES-53]